MQTFRHYLGGINEFPMFNFSPSIDTKLALVYFLSNSMIHDLAKANCVAALVIKCTKGTLLYSNNFELNMNLTKV